MDPAFCSVPPYQASPSGQNSDSLSCPRTTLSLLKESPRLLEKGKPATAHQRTVAEQYAVCNLHEHADPIRPASVPQGNSCHPKWPLVTAEAGHLVRKIRRMKLKSQSSPILKPSVDGVWHVDFKNMLFPADHEFVPNITEIFEWELAFMERKRLSPKEMVERSAMFSWIGKQQTNHYRLCLFNDTASHKHKNIVTQAHFKARRFSAGYGVDGLFPYRGKFHPQLAKAILNIMGLKRGDTLLDPMAGCSTACFEASLLGIHSIGVDISPFCTLMSEAKCAAMTIDPSVLVRVVPDKAAFLEFMGQAGSVARLPAYVDEGLRTTGPALDEQEVAHISKLLQLIYLDAMGWVERCKKKTLPDLFPKVFDRYVATVVNFRKAAGTLDLHFGTARFHTASALALPLENASVDGVLTSPPYSFAVDYAKNDNAQLEFLGHNVEELRNTMIGLRGGSKAHRITQYFIDLRTALREMHRVLKPGKMCVVIIGSNDIQTGGIRHEVEVKKAAAGVGFELRKEMVKPIKGMRNSMREEFILFFQKPAGNLFEAGV